MLMDGDDFVYSNTKVRGRKVYWRCLYCPLNKGHCLAKAVTEGFQIIRKSEVHNHEPGTPLINVPIREVKKKKSCTTDLVKTIDFKKKDPLKSSSKGS
jgi:hypothetical protein